MTKQEFLMTSLTNNLKVKILCGDGVFDIINNLTVQLLYELGPSRLTPIVRPLSDLTKPIEHKGEKFVPMTKLLKMEGYEHFFENGHKGKNACVIDCWWINTEFDDKPKPYEKFCTWHLDRVSFEDALKLIEWHFDLADLISKGEAIDINTLEENPYK